MAGRCKGVSTQIRGDWEFVCTLFNLPKWSEGRNMCWICRAVADGILSFTDCSPTAAWRATRRTHEGFLRELRRAGKALPIMFQKVKGLRLECIMIDVLHTVDQGIASHIFGNVFWLCVSQRCFGGSNLEKNLEMLNAEIKKFYKTRPNLSKIQGKVTVERLRSSSLEESCPSPCPHHHSRPCRCPSP